MPFSRGLRFRLMGSRPDAYSEQGQPLWQTATLAAFGSRRPFRWRWNWRPCLMLYGKDRSIGVSRSISFRNAWPIVLFAGWLGSTAIAAEPKIVTAAHVKGTWETKMSILVNFILFQVAWFACVLGGAREMPWVGPVVVAVVAAYHLARTRDPKSELSLLAIAAGIGLVFDSTLTATGWLSYPSGQWHPMLAPYWMVALWVAFATTLNVSMNRFKGRHLLAFGFGAVGGPLAYLAGANLGAVTFNNPPMALAALALGWAITTPVLVMIAQRLTDRRSSPLCAPEIADDSGEIRV